MAIFELCFQHSIKLEMDWILRSLNSQAEFLSRIVDYDDWEVDPCIFQAIDSSWDPHSVDWFASSHNALLPCFHSRFWSPGCEAVNTFTVNWGNELNWWVSPLHLICRTIHHDTQCRAKDTFIIPAWKSAPFWPVICPDSRHLAPFVHQWWTLQFYLSMF